MKKPKQLSLSKKDLRFFGGMLLMGRRKSKRPFHSKDALHLVMRSSWAKGENSFLRPRNKASIERLIERVARNCFVKVYQVAIVGNHIHLVMKAPNLKKYQIFIRVLSSQVASHVMKNQSFKDFRRTILNKNAGDPPHMEPQGQEQQFWQMRPFTRLLHWGRDFKTACSYVKQNRLEALGFIPYKTRKNRYAKWIRESDPGDPPLTAARTSTQQRSHARAERPPGSSLKTG